MEVEKCLIQQKFNNFGERENKLLKKALELFDVVYIVVITNDYSETDEVVSIKQQFIQTNLLNIRVIVKSILNDVESLNRFCSDHDITHIVKTVNSTNEFKEQNTLDKIFRGGVETIYFCDQSINKL